MSNRGKDHFRQCWAQRPVYSGGPIASLVPTARDAVDEPPLLAMAFGCTLNVMRTTDGATVASFTGPIDEDIVLHVAATGVPPPEAPKDADDHVNGDAIAAAATDGDGDEGFSSVTQIVLGTVAFSTESRQIYALKLTRDLLTMEYSLSVIKSWTAAQHAIAVLRFSPDGAHLASGATDGGLKVWDVFHHHITHNYRGKGGIVTCVIFSASGHMMAAGTVEGYLSIIDFTSKEVIIAGRPYNSPIETCSFFEDGSLACVGRDRRVAVFNARTLDERKAIVLRDHVVSAIFATPTEFFVGSPDGVVVQCRLSENGAVAVRARTPAVAHATEAENSIRSFALVPQSALMAEDAATGAGSSNSAKRHRTESDNDMPILIAADGSQRLHFIRALATSAPSAATGLKVEKALCGYLDQIFDVKLITPSSNAKAADAEAAAEEEDDDVSDEPHTFARAVASNSKDVMIFGTAGCDLTMTLQGHSDLVTSLDVSADGHYIASASKDETVRLWNVRDGICVGVGYGHSGAVSAVAMNPKMDTGSLFVLISVGSDEAVKMWDARKPQTGAEGRTKWEPIQTVANTHAGPIHCLAIAPNDAFVATGGKDKSVLLYAMKGKGLTKLGAFTGHRRTVNAVAFSPVDRLLISASNDGAVKVWSLATMNCARTLQHDKIGVTQARFFNGGHQIVTANAHGILRVWAVGAAEVVATLEGNEDRVWALAVVETAKATHFVTGGADSSIIAFEDYTAEEVQRLKDDKKDFLLLSQKLQNAIRRKDWQTAFTLALKLKHPRHLRGVITMWLAEDESGCEDGLTDIIFAASENDLFKLLEFVRSWIANARHSSVAAVVVAALLRAHHFSALRKMPAVKETIEALAGYNKRHEARVATALEQLHYVDYLTRTLRPVGARQSLVTLTKEAGHKRPRPQEERLADDE
jgi:U3 small nucleolar RNA-associated protein 13